MPEELPHETPSTWEMLLPVDQPDIPSVARVEAYMGVVGQPFPLHLLSLPSCPLTYLAT